MRTVTSCQLQVLGSSAPRRSGRSRFSTQSHSSDVTEASWSSWASRTSKTSEASGISRRSGQSWSNQALPRPRKTWSWLPGTRQSVRSPPARSSIVSQNDGASPDSEANTGESSASRGFASSVISRISLADAAFAINGFSGGRGHGNMWASLFGIRVKVSTEYQRRLLCATHGVDDNGLGQDLESDYCDEHPPLQCSHWRLFFAGRFVGEVLQVLAIVSVVLVPMIFSAEPACGFKFEKDLVRVARMVHLVVALIYAVIGFTQFWAIMWALPSRAWGQRLCRHHLYFDMMALTGVSIDLLYLAAGSVELPFWCRILWLSHILKLWRAMGPTALTSAELRGVTFQIGILFLELFLAAHTFACVFVWLAIKEARHGADTWADPFIREKETLSCIELYTASLYFCTYTLTSIGYGDLVPANVLEHAASVLFMLASQMFAAKVFAQLTWITATHQHWKAQHHARLTQTVAALDSMGVHNDLYERVLAYQDFIEEEQKERRAQECLRDLSRPLREELRLVVHYDLVSQAPFLQAQPTFLVRNIISALSDVVYLPCDVIIRRGDVGDELFFLRSGRAGVFTCAKLPEWTDKEVLVLRRGFYFGEVSLLTGQPRSSWVVARTYCMCSVLPKHVIDTIMSDNPACIKGLVCSLKNVLCLKPHATWEDIGKRMKKEFENDDLEAFVYDFTCSGEDGEAPAGLVTWSRFNILMQRLHVAPLDRKLFWVELDEDSEGIVAFAELWAKSQGNSEMRRESPELQRDAESPSPSLSGVPEGRKAEPPEPRLAEILPPPRPSQFAGPPANYESQEDDGAPNSAWMDGEQFSLRSSLTPSKRSFRRKSSVAARISGGRCSSWASPLPALLLTPDAASTEAKQERMLTDIVKRLASVENKVNTLSNNLCCLGGSLEEQDACGN